MALRDPEGLPSLACGMWVKAIHSNCFFTALGTLDAGRSKRALTLQILEFWAGAGDHPPPLWCWGTPGRGA